MKMIPRRLLLVFLMINNFPDLSDARHIGQEIIRITQHSPKPRAKRDLNTDLFSPIRSILSGSDFPEHMEFTLHLKDGDKKLDLWKQRTLEDITVKNHKGVVKFDETKTQFAVYQDTVTHSVMIVDCGHSVDFCTLTGSFYHLGKKLNIKPMNNSLVNYNVTQAISNFNPKSTGSIKANGTNTKRYQSNTMGEQQLNELFMDHFKRNGHKIQKRSTIASECNILQINVYAYFSVYEYYLARECGNTLAAAIELLKHYLALYGEVDLRYKCLGELDHPICLRVFLNTITFETSSSGTKADSDNDGFIDSVPVLQDCRNKIDTSTHPDYTMCSTKFDIEYEDDPFVNGIGYFGVICTEHGGTNRVGLIEDLGDDANLNIASLLLSGLGIPADTFDGEPECNATFLFIGAEANDPPVHPSTIENPWKFSNCSINKLKIFLNFLDTSNEDGNCLKSGSISEDDFEAFTLKRPFPGKIFDLDYQCQLTYGLSSFAVIGPNETSIFEVDDICYQGVYCDVNGDRTFRTRIYNGSPCGCKEICVKNLCVREFNTPLGGDCLGCCECADSNSICDCETRTCVCDEGFYDDNLAMPNGTCRLLKGNNETCPFDEACEDEYAICDNNTNVCVCIEGWTLRDGVCVKVCSNDTLPYVERGMFILQDIVKGSIANLKCDEGYVPTSIDTCSVCRSDGNFSATMIHCKRDCGCPPQTPNGDFVLDVMGNTTLGSTATLVCSDGFSTNVMVTITCENTTMGWSDASQNCTINDCGNTLPNVTNGMYMATKGTTVGKAASLVCDYGYTPMSTDTCIMCLSNGNWSHPNTGCVRDCECPPEAANGNYVLNTGNTTEGSVATLNCCEGYSTNSMVTITCEDTPKGWSHPSENCTINDCGDTLPYVTNGMYVATQGTTVGKAASLVCDHGYTPMSTDTCIMCLTNGNWSYPNTGCIRDCECPLEVANGNYVLNTGNTTEGSLATLNCCEGYSTNSMVTITCEDTPKGWSHPSENCTINDCGNTLPNVTNGMYMATQGTTVGKAASLVCNHGYTPMSTDTCIMCLSNGNWSHPNTGCVRDCECPPEVTNGNYVLSTGNTTEGSVATLNCCVGYSTNSMVTITCEDTPDGWSHPSENCTINDCGNTLPNVINGMYVATQGTTVGKAASLVCDHGYTPMSTDTCIMCLTNGSWSHPNTGCVRDCECPPEAANGNYILNMGNTTEGSVATLNCCVGYSTNSMVTITCEDTPKGWSHPSENCTINDCGDNLPSVTNGMYVATQGTTVGKAASLVCDHGYTPIATDTCITCLTNGSWSHPNTGCVRDCECPPEGANGNYILNTGNTTEGSVATLNCCEGYSTNSLVTITCEDTPKGWSHPSENCTINDCGNTLPNVANGMYVATQGTTVGKAASLVCDYGYTPMSTDTCIMCLTNGSWSHPNTGCVRDCECPPEVANGNYVLNTGNTTEGSVATLNCCEGYSTNSMVTITCEDTPDGWSYPDGNCTINDCGTSLPVVTNGSYVTTGAGTTTVGSLGVLVCNSGFTPMSEDTCIICQPNGTWSHPSTDCIRDCDCPPEAIFGSFTLDDPDNTTLGATAQYNCCPGYELLSSVTITCTIHGWSRPSENCTLKDCGATPAIANGSAAPSDGSTVGSTAIVTCDYGFSPTSSETCIVCELSGNWSSPMVECIVDCGCPPEVANGEYILDDDTNTTIGSTAELHCCPDAFVMSPPVIITCESSGHWSSPSENCIVRDCGTPPSITNGTYIALGVTTVGGIAVLSCDDGYVPLGLNVNIICTNDGNWSMPNTICLRDCGCPPEASNGAYTLTVSGNTTEGATALLSCCPAYETSTTVLITCENTAQGWSDPVENCSLKVCDDSTLPSVANGGFVPQAESVGSLAILECDNLTSPDSNEICVVCQMDGTWSSSSTMCITDCGIPPITSTAGFFLQNGTTNLGDTARICCTEGNAVPLLGFDSTITCTASGWSNLTTAICRDCPSGWTRLDNTCYLLQADVSTYSQAVDFCDTFDSFIYKSNLVKIDNEEENEFLKNLMDNFHPQPKSINSNNVGFWIGLVQLGANGQSETWLPSGLTLTDTGFDDWNTQGSQEPNGADQFCSFAFQNFHYRWTDVECVFNGAGSNGRTGFPLCEIDL